MTSITVTAVLGNGQRLDGGAMFGNAPRAVWEKWIRPDDLGRIPLSCRAMLVEIDGRLLLCETGIGAFFEPKMASRYGVYEERHVLLDSLKAIGVSEADLDFVILSHLHFDHAGGLLPSWQSQQSGLTDLLFPRAKYVVGSVAFDRSVNPHPRDRASFIPGLADKLRQSGRLILVDQETHPDVLPEFVTFEFTDGHTPGHMHTIVKGNHGSLIFAGDLIPGKAWVHLPITMGYDRFAEMVIDEKSGFYQRYAGERNWFFFTHDHETAMARINKDESGKFAAYAGENSPLRYAF
jgi:glyoxylase-like metal-dependent hydrolase (beta-lactamase superfamily II)